MRGLQQLRASYIHVIILDYTSHTPDGNQVLIYPIWADVVKRIWWIGITIGASEVYAHLINLEDDNSRSMKQHRKQMRRTNNYQKQRAKTSPTLLPPCQAQRRPQTGAGKQARTPSPIRARACLRSSSSFHQDWELISQKKLKKSKIH